MRKTKSSSRGKPLSERRLSEEREGEKRKEREEEEEALPH